VDTDQHVADQHLMAQHTGGRARPDKPRTSLAPA
jgi:hypothetical protein